MLSGDEESFEKACSFAVLTEAWKRVGPKRRPAFKRKDGEGAVFCKLLIHFHRLQRTVCCAAHTEPERYPSGKGLLTKCILGGTFKIPIGVQTMSRTPKIIPISDLRQNASDVVRGVSSSREPVFITQRGRAAAVLVSMEAYEDSQREIEVLRLLAEGRKKSMQESP